MTTNSRISSRLTVSLLAAAAVAGLATASPAAGTSHPTSAGACSIHPATLPRTPDAEEGWYTQCRAQQHFATKSAPPPPATDSRQDYTSWLTNPTAEPRSDRGGHHQELPYPQNKPHLAGSHKVAGPSLDRGMADRAPWLKRSPSTEDGSLDLAQFAFGGLAGIMIAAAAGRLVGRRRRLTSLEAALAPSDPDDAPRAAGLLGDLFLHQSRAGAAEHAYRAAVDVDHPYWSPVAQVALAQLLNDRGDREEARALLDAAIASGHPRTVPLARASLDKLLTRDSDHQAVGPPPKAFETLGDFTPAHR